MAGPSSVPVFGRFFRSVAQLKVDENDVKQFRAFVDEMVDDIAIAGRNSVRWSDRDVVAPMDLPITKGFRERMREFTKLDVDVRAVLAEGVRRPPAGMTFSEETEEVLPELFGGLSIAFARTFGIGDPEVVDPSTEHRNPVTDLLRQVS
ncbi:DUF1931 family protein [Pseudonocardia kujensis]|uniref:DUF1931 family protein n=1 Tax=Pseudonocardia kujensis TaxID=1128675 RepID=UPI001E5DF607|nr:DUF1931 family protein [Pseudonocardia kujensis]MCE0765110.1 DUF1931 family protein [Pseudonocardia kujensis]